MLRTHRPQMVGADHARSIASWLRGFVASWLVVASFASHVRAEFPNGVAAGDVDHDSAVLWARSTAIGPIQFIYSTSPDFADAVTVDATVEDTDEPVKVEISVEPGRTYYYRVGDAAESLAEGTFRTPPADGFNGVRFGVTGDWRGDLRPYPAIHNVVESDLDFFVILGDTIYADIASNDVPVNQARTLDELRRKHNEAYSERFGINTFAEIRSATAQYVCIDDHEMTNDFCGGAHPSTDLRFDQNGTFINETDLYRNGMQAFQDYNPVRAEVYGETGDPRTAGKPKLYRHRRFGSDAAMIMVDARSFRDDTPELLEHIPSFLELQQYYANAHNPARTMLSAVQLGLLKEDLLAAQREGITWKFLMFPEPVQNLGPIIGSDRFEGFAAERADLLAFINENEIENVVFVTADIHGTIINNITYRRAAGGPQIDTDAFEVTTGSVAFAKPLGAATIEVAPPAVQGWFVGKTPLQRDRLTLNILNSLLFLYRYSPVGLADSSVDGRLVEGAYLAVNWFGWSMFEIDAQTQRLSVTTYGIPWYSKEEIEANPDEVLSRVPRVVSKIEVDPKGRFAPQSPPTPGPALCGALGMTPMFTLLGLMLLSRRITGRARIAR